MNIKFLGNGSGFSETHTNAYFITNKNELVIIDLSMKNYDKLINFPLHKYKNISLLVTHMHDDHTSGIGLFIQYCYYVLQRKLSIVLPDNKLKDDFILLMNIKGIPESIYDIKQEAEWLLAVIPTTHAPDLSGKCFGYVLDVNEKKCVYSGDTNTIAPFLQYLESGVEFYLDTSYSYGAVHVKYEDVKDKLLYIAETGVDIILMHVDDITMLEREIEETPFEIAEIVSPNMYSDEEIKAIKKDFAFDKIGIVNRVLEACEKNEFYGHDKNKINFFVEQVKQTSYPSIKPDFTNKQVLTYVLDTLDMKIIKTYIHDLKFVYYEEDKAIYVSEACWED